MNRHTVRWSCHLLLVMLMAALAAWGQSGSNGVYGGYVGSSGWFDAMRQTAADQAMLHSLGGGNGAGPAAVPPGYVEIAGILHFTVSNPFPDGRLPDLHIECTDPTADGVQRAPFFDTRQPAQPTFYTVLKQGQTYSFSWLYYLGSTQQLGTWTVPSGGPPQMTLVLNVDMKGNVTFGDTAGPGGPAPGGYPAPAGAYPTPPESGYTVPQGGGYTPPQTGNGYTPPPTGTPYTPPQSDGAYTPPQSDGAYTPPQSDGAYTPPQSDGAYTPPQSDAGSAAPQTYPQAPGGYPPASPYPGGAAPIPGSVTPQPPVYPGGTMGQAAVSGPPQLPQALQAVSNLMRSLPQAQPATPANPPAAPSANGPAPAPSQAAAPAPAPAAATSGAPASSTLQLDPSQFDLGGLSTPPKNAQEAALWKQILGATTTTDKAKAHQALSAYYQSQGNTRLALREALRAQYWSAGGHW